MSCGVGCRCSLDDLALLWLWRRPAAAAPIQPLAWELPYAVGAALKKKKKNGESRFMSLSSSRADGFTESVMDLYLIELGLNSSGKRVRFGI